MATDSNILAWRIPWTEEPGRLCGPWGRKEPDTTDRLTHTHTHTHTHTKTFQIKKKALNPLCSAHSSLLPHPWQPHCLHGFAFFRISYVCMHAKSLQLYLILCNPMDCSPPSSSVLGDSPGKNTGVGCHALLQGIFPIQGSNPNLLCLLHRQAIISTTWEVQNVTYLDSYRTEPFQITFFPLVVCIPVSSLSFRGSIAF